MLTGRIAADGELLGKLSGGEALGGTLSNAGELTCALSIESGLAGGLSADGTLSGALSFGTAETPIYPGPYDVTPRFSEQSLATQGLTMRQDVTVYEIPVVRTTNPYDGITVVIG